MSNEHLIGKIASFRETFLRGCLTVFNPRLLAAKDYDVRLAKSIEDRWSDQVISVLRLVYEVTDKRGTVANQVIDSAPEPAAAAIGTGLQGLGLFSEPAVAPEADRTVSAATPRGQEATDAGQETPPTANPSIRDESPEANNPPGSAITSTSGEVADAVRQPLATANPAKDFLVFIDPHLEVEWLSDVDVPDDGKRLIAAAESCAAVDCEFLAKRKLLGYRLQIAQVIVCAIQGQVLDGQRLLAEANSYLHKRVVERSRQWTLISLLIIGVIALVLTSASMGGLYELPRATPLVGSLEGGFLGAFVSIAAKTGRAQCDAAAGRTLHFLEVLIRLVIGVVFGGVSIGLAGSSLGPDPAKMLIASPEGILILSFASGLFEQSVPRMLSKYTPLMEKSET